ncbi:phage minor head protein [uncultured Ruminococcus sp.]|jgi:hypothetical protein|uniref:phage head morphogenesis protein n=1 Tax=uncultured Ruminococcus sp. TaxID=165186 RepID=UPI0026DB275C|nr:phage minor head protein [uncultured Ruminococcus sp.]
MTPAQKQTTQYELLSEKKVMEQLERSYQKALEAVKDRLRQLDERTDVENRQAVAYQKAFQQGLQKQLERILGKLHSKTYRTVQEYLQDCYLTGHTAVLYELQSDGLRLSLPIPQDKVYQAAINDTKLVKPLYDSIGEDFAGLKKHITDIVSAGFASGASYGDMANQITGKMIGNYATMRGGALGRAKLIVRTEGNRIANAARLEAARTAKQQGADLVKQWDSTMDKKTRPHHVQLDGQVRELDEPFEVDGRKAQAPGKFGIASEDINCRCHAYSRPRWAVRADSDYKYDNEHRELTKVSGTSYAAYRAGYVQETAGKPGGTVPVPAGDAVEVTPPTPKGNGGSGKTYSPEKIREKSLTSGADGGIIKMGKAKKQVIAQAPADFSKYTISEDVESVQVAKNSLISSFGLEEEKVSLDGICNAEVLKPFADQLIRIHEQTGFKLPNIHAVEMIDGDPCCIAGYKPMENRFYISSRYFNSKEALLDTLKSWASSGILPKQGKSIRYLAEHESAHMRIPDKLLQSEEAQKIQKAFLHSKSYNDNDAKIEEFFADAIAIYRMNPSTTDTCIVMAVEYLKKAGIT